MVLSIVRGVGEAVQDGWGEVWRGITLVLGSKLRVTLSKEFLNPAQVN